VLISTVSLLLVCGTATWAGPEAGHWLLDHERGWFWYEDPIILEKEPEPEPPEEEAQPQPTPGPPPLSAQWIRENLEKYQMKAIDDPTPENIAMFLYLQRVMLDKAQRFSEGVTRVVQFDPLLDENTRRPTASFGGAVSSRQALEARRDILNRIAHPDGIFFFFRSDCQHCEVEAPLLKTLEQVYGFKVFPVSLDGRPLPNNLFGNYVPDRGQAQKLGVVQTPAMFLGRPDNREVLLISQSTMARPQLEERIIEAAYEAGWINQQEYQSTKSWNSWMALDLRPGQVSEGMNDAQLLEFLKRMYTVQAGLALPGE